MQKKFVKWKTKGQGYKYKAMFRKRYIINFYMCNLSNLLVGSIVPLISSTGVRVHGSTIVSIQEGLVY